MRRNCLVLVILATFSCLGTAPVTAGIIFSDDFNGGASPLWGNEVGNWTAAGGVYFAQSPNNNPTTYSGLPFNLGDFSIDVDINRLQDGGIWLRSVDNRNGVLLVTGGNGGTGTGLYWHIVQNGSFSPSLNQVGGLFTPGVSNAHLRVVVSGDTYSAYVDGNSTPATTLTTAAFTSGRVGLYDFSRQTFDNVIVATAVPEPASLVMLGTGAFVILCRFRRRGVSEKVG